MTVGFAGSGDQLPGLMHFLAHHIKGNMAAQGHPRKFQGKKDTFPPDQFSPTPCKACTTENRTKKHLLFQTTIRRRCLHMSQNQETGHRLIPIHLLAIRCKPITAHALTVCAGRKGLHCECKGLLADRTYFLGTFQKLDDVRKRTACHGCR